jgi:hypothetical protein
MFVSIPWGDLYIYHLCNVWAGKAGFSTKYQDFSHSTMFMNMDTDVHKTAGGFP